jgi:hypothetical protein
LLCRQPADQLSFAIDSNQVLFCEKEVEFQRAVIGSVDEALLFRV